MADLPAERLNQRLEARAFDAVVRVGYESRDDEFRRRPPQFAEPGLAIHDEFEIAIEPFGEDAVDSGRLRKRSQILRRGRDEDAHGVALNRQRYEAVQQIGGAPRVR